jgi:hypothetical protein
MEVHDYGREAEANTNTDGQNAAGSVFDAWEDDVCFIKLLLRAYAERVASAIPHLPPPTTHSEMVSSLRMLSLYILRYDDATGSAADPGLPPVRIRVQYDTEPGEQPAD